MGTPVHVWLVQLAEAVASTAALDARERRFAASIAHPRDRQRYITMHSRTRLLLADLLGLPPERVRWEHGPQGKPRLVGESIQVNISHSADLGLVAVSDTRPVGVDVEKLWTGADAARMAERYFAPAEARYVAEAPQPEQAHRFVRLWTRKEACLKAAGGRLTQALRLPVLGTGDIVVRDPPLPGPYFCRDVPVPAGFLAAVAVAGAEPAEVTVGSWP